MKDLKIAVIGGAGHYEYALPSIKKYGFSVCAMAAGAEDEDISRALGDISSLGQEPKIYTDWREMIEKEKPDVVIINSYMGYNAEMCVYAFERGISVFCEKPVSTTLEGLMKVRSAYDSANARGRVVCAGMFGITYAPHFETARRFIADGGVGDVRLISAQKSYRLGKREPFYSDRALLGGLIPWVAIHAIDWIYALTDFDFCAVTAAHSTVANGGNGSLEASAAMMFEGRGGTAATVTADYLRPNAAPSHDDDRLRVAGTKGIIEVRGGRVYVIDEKGERELQTFPPEHDIFEEFALDVQGAGACRSDAKELFDVTEIALISRQSADEGRKIGISL